VSQRKCGTCRYFEEGGIAASGWCRHPERQDLQHTVLVRKTELACRTGHGRVLWEPAGTAAERPRAVPGQDIELVGAHVVRPAMFAASSTSQVHGVHRPSETVALRPGQRFLDDEESDDFLNPLTPRVRGSNQFQLAAADGQRTGGSAGDPDRIPGDGEDRSEPLSARDLSITWGAKFKELRRQGEDEPAIRPTSEVTLPQREPESSEQRAPSVARYSQSDGQHYGADWMPTQRDTRGQRTDDVAHRFGTYATELSTERRSTPVPQSGSTQEIEFPEIERPFVDHAGFDGQRQETTPTAMMSDVGEPEESELAPVAHPSIDELPKCCRTCRDFRPIDGGIRGVCNNAYAVTSERMVEPDDLPCDGTFGNWWTPTDDWWRGRADISHHYGPTPLVDELLRSRSPQLGEGGSTGRRRTT
jgi:hypothetical protein